MLMLLFEKLGVSNLELLVNSIGCRECRPPFVERLKGEIEERSSRLCVDCRRRAETNPLRVFDCKVPSCQEPIAELPTITDSLCETCRDHFEKFRGYLDDRKIEYRVEKGLVRGLDYYMRTTLEIVSSELGAQDTLVGGGRYDGLFEDLDGPPMKGFGFAMGLERLILSIPEPEKTAFGDLVRTIFLATIADEAFNYATLLAQKLRAGKRVVYLDFDPRSLKSQMRLAGKLAARNVVILGEDEVRSGKLTVRDMDSREQQEMTEEEFLQAARAHEVGPDQMAMSTDFARTHSCSELTSAEEGTEVALAGWVDRRRDHGQLVFIDLRDREGITQIVFNPERDADAYRSAKDLRSEFVIGVRGKVRRRDDDMIKPESENGRNRGRRRVRRRFQPGSDRAVPDRR